MPKVITNLLNDKYSVDDNPHLSCTRVAVENIVCFVAPKHLAYKPWILQYEKHRDRYPAPPPNVVAANNKTQTLHKMYNTFFFYKNPTVTLFPLVDE